MNDASNRILAELLEARTGQQLPPSRRWRIGTALSGLYRELGITHLDQLIAMMAQSRDSVLAQRVVEALLNNETYFFRDRAVFDQLAQATLPELAKRRADRRHLSIWSAGCSTGQEALSLAMLFCEQESRWAGWTIDIIGTDVSRSVIEVARKGCYSPFEIQRGLGMVQMLQWFEESPDGWCASDRLKRMVRFQTHSILEPLPATSPFDLILCRNLLLYFAGENRARVYNRLAAALAPDGFLMLGAGETVIGHTEQFLPETGMVGIYSQTRAGIARRSEMRRCDTAA